VACTGIRLTKNEVKKGNRLSVRSAGIKSTFRKQPARGGDKILFKNHQESTHASVRVFHRVLGRKARWTQTGSSSGGREMVVSTCQPRCDTGGLTMNVQGISNTKPQPKIQIGTRGTLIIISPYHHLTAGGE